MTDEPDDEKYASQRRAEKATRVFGAGNRDRLLRRYFDGVAALEPGSAWLHVYRLLLWIDRTTALAHCYESDKAQPGRPWYLRSLAFHDWLSKAFEVAPDRLGGHVDWLFREAVKELTSQALVARSAAYLRQRDPYTGRGFPEPGEDPELADIVREMLEPWLSEPPPNATMRQLTQRIHAHLNQENKRRNLVGEGFEDVLAAILLRLAVERPLVIRQRATLHELPGFYRAAPGEKIKKVDLAIIADGRRILVSAKWSIRADREEQFLGDFEAYARLESAGQDFAYVLITNEFDAARLKAACQRRRQNAYLFSQIVHINPAAVLAAYADTGRGAALEIASLISAGRLIALSDWLGELVKE